MERVKSEIWGQCAGRDVLLYTLKNVNGLTVQVTDYGATLVSVCVPDKSQTLGDVILGYSSFADHEAGKPNFGSIVGRYANRIANASFTIDGQAYKLNANNGYLFFNYSCVCVCVHVCVCVCVCVCACACACVCVCVCVCVWVCVCVC